MLLLASTQQDRQVARVQRVRASRETLVTAPDGVCRFFDLHRGRKEQLKLTPGVPSLAMPLEVQNIIFLARKISVKNFVCAHSTGAFYNDTASLPSPPRGRSVELVDNLSKKESWAFKGNKCSSGSILCKLQRDSETSTVWTHFLTNESTNK